MAEAYRAYRDGQNSLRPPQSSREPAPSKAEEQLILTLQGYCGIVYRYTQDTPNWERVLPCSPLPQVTPTNRVMTLLLF